jgi:hypothetical protein
MDPPARSPLGKNFRDRQWHFHAVPLSLFALLLVVVFAADGAPAAATPTPGGAVALENSEVLRAQLFLDGSAFKPGVIDGRWGEFTAKALGRYEQAQGHGGQSYGAEPPMHFDLPFDRSKPALTVYRITTADQKAVGSIPKSRAEQAKRDQLPYESLLELVAEKFHARREFLQQINPGYDWSKAKPGDEVQVPNVATPFDIEAVREQEKQTKQSEKAGTLKTEDRKPES